MCDKFRTPLLGNISEKDFDLVYEPAEDSFLLLDVLEKEDEFLQRLKPSVCVEVGCGSGVCITFLSQVIENPAVFFCTDINPKAAEMTHLTALRNDKKVEPVVCNLMDAFDDRLKGAVDVLLFNPPLLLVV
uniref:Methyltransferase small domain-containing protein n=1 Tax=Arion vulgaris TaxID=1028688 RepID=A0A0B7A7E7_9EUPU